MSGPDSPDIVIRHHLFSFLECISCSILLSLFSDNQATGSIPSKAAAPTARPKGSVIDLTEDDDDVQGKV